MTAIRVLVVDDSVVVRRMVAEAIEADPAIDVVGVAHNGVAALVRVEQLKPDLITMDIEMPELDGIEAVAALRARGDRTPIIMFSTLTLHGASATLDALAHGASDYVTKPARVADRAEAIAVITSQLVPKIKALCGRPRAGAVPVRTATVRGAMRTPQAVVIGSSTGGPEALSTVIRDLGPPLPVPVLIVQHMPPVFTAQLAARLDRLSPARVVEAAAGDTLEPGTIYIAPGDHHLEVAAAGNHVRTVLTQSAPVNFCRPSVDVLFHSAARVWGGDIVSVVLTGMGSDGRDGAKEIHDAGGRVIAQDEASSVVWGMPGAVTGAGVAHHVLPISQIASAISRLVPRARTGVRA